MYEMIFGIGLISWIIIGIFGSVIFAARNLYLEEMGKTISLDSNYEMLLWMWPILIPAALIALPFLWFYQLSFRLEGKRRKAKKKYEEVEQVVSKADVDVCSCVICSWVRRTEQKGIFDV